VIRLTFHALLLVASLFRPTVARATFPGGNGLLVYTVPTSVQSGGAIWKLNPDLTGEAAFTVFPPQSFFRNPKWSPGGKSIAAWQGLVGGPVLYLTVNDAGGDTIGFTDVQGVQTLVPGFIENAGPTWSPDETQLAVALGLAGGGVYLIDIATQAIHLVAANPSADVIYDQPAWSPDGTQIAVRIHQSLVGTYGHRDDIGVFPAGGGAVTNLTNNRNPDGSDGDAGCASGGPNWRPDGHRIVYHLGACDRPIVNQGVASPDPYSRIAAVDVPGGALTLLAPRALDVFPAYSPDGTMIVAWGIPFQQNTLHFFTAAGAPLSSFITSAGLVTGPPDWQPIVAGRRLDASLAVDPTEVSLGTEFTATLTVKNPLSQNLLIDVQPVGNLALTGDGEVLRISGPEPASVAALAPGASQAFAWKYQATKVGTAVLKGQVQGHERDGTLVTVDAKCGLGGGASSPLHSRAADPPATCRIDGGTEVTISQCTVELEDESSTLEIVTLDGDSTEPAGHNYPSGGT
jgi:hypothetical protein